MQAKDLIVTGDARVIGTAAADTLVENGKPLTEKYVAIDSFPAATDSTLGGVKISLNGTTLTISTT